MMKIIKIYLLFHLLLIYDCSENSVQTNVKFEIEIIDANVVSVYAIALSSNGNYIAWAGLGNDISLKGKPKLKGHIGSVNSLEFIDVGSLLLSGSNDHNIKIWDVESGSLIRTFSEHITVTRDAKFTPDGKSVISAEDDYLIYWRNAVSGQIGRLPMYGHSGSVLTVDMSTDMQIIVSGSSDKTVKIWDAQTGEMLNSIAAHNKSVYQVEFNPVINQFASCSSDSTIKIWDSESAELIKMLDDNDCKVNAISYHPSGNYLASCGSNSLIYIWDLSTSKKIRTLEGHNGTINIVKFSKDGNSIISGGADDKVFIWRNVFAETE